MAISAAAVTDAGEDVPRSGCGQKQGPAEEWMQAPPFAPLAGKPQIEQHRAKQEDQRDQTLGQYGSGERKPRGQCPAQPSRA